MAIRAQRYRGVDIWPGFVDALATLLLVFVFLLSIFVFAQFFLNQALSGRDQALVKLEQQVADMGQLLNLERQANRDLRLNVAQLSSSLQTANRSNEDLTERAAQLAGTVDAAERGRAAAEAELQNIGSNYRTSERALASGRDQIAVLTDQIAALRLQLQSIESLLAESEGRDLQNEAIISDLGQRLNVALAGKVQELSRYRSEFFGRLREVIGERADIRVVGDRFVFQSEVLFASGSADLGTMGQTELDKLAATLLAIMPRIPKELNWILRVDGHTDRLPIRSERFPSNWELSTARATSVVKYLVARGIPAQRLAAAGFGPYQPLEPGDNPEAYQINRRIELKLTQR